MARENEGDPELGDEDDYDPYPRRITRRFHSPQLGNQTNWLNYWTPQHIIHNNR